MSIHTLIESYPWSQYSKELTRRIENPQCCGTYTPEDAQARGMHLAIGSSGSIESGNIIKVYCLVDASDAVIADARFQAFGDSVLIGIGDATCESIIGKNYDQAQRIGASNILSTLKDRSDTLPFPESMTPHLNLVLESIDDAMEQCKHITLPQTYAAPPSPLENASIQETEGYLDWNTFDNAKQRVILEQVLNDDIRPFIAMDAGGVDLLDIRNNKEVIIAYNGSCTSCFSAVGATLGYIQETLRAKIHKELVVVPDMDNMDMSWR
jgi:NifU-like protein